MSSSQRAFAFGNVPIYTNHPRGGPFARSLYQRVSFDVVHLPAGPYDTKFNVKVLYALNSILDCSIALGSVVGV